MYNMNLQSHGQTIDAHPELDTYYLISPYGSGMILRPHFCLH
jgi:hypothetical protein